MRNRSDRDIPLASPGTRASTLRTAGRGVWCSDAVATDTVIFGLLVRRWSTEKASKILHSKMGRYF
jgi:hypothetical protein